MIPLYELNDQFFLIQKFSGHCKWVKKKKKSKLEYAISEATLNVSASGTAVEGGEGIVLVRVCSSMQCVCIYGMEMTESQNCRGQKEHLEISESDHPAGSVQQVAQEGIQEGLEYLLRRLHSLSRLPVPVLCHPHSKEVPPCAILDVNENRIKLQLYVGSFLRLRFG